MATKQVLARLNRLKLYMLQNPQGAKLKSIIDAMGEDRQVVQKDLNDIGATVRDEPGIYFYQPTEDEIKLAQALIVAALNQQ